jgi:hypothetical protein
MIPQDFSNRRLRQVNVAQAWEHCANAADVLHLCDVAPLAAKLSDQSVEPLQTLRNLDTTQHTRIAAVDVVPKVRGDRRQRAGVQPAPPCQSLPRLLQLQLIGVRDCRLGSIPLYPLAEIE